MAFWVGDAGNRLGVGVVRANGASISPMDAVGGNERLMSRPRGREHLPLSYYSEPPSPPDIQEHTHWPRDTAAQHHYTDLGSSNHAFSGPREAPPPLPPTNLPGGDQSFIVIRERCPSSPGFLGHQGRSLSAPTSTAMERTESGLSISSETSHRSRDCPGGDGFSPALLSDRAAARAVRDHLANFRRRNPASQHGRILRSLILPKSRGAEFALDNDALQSIFLAANEIFFANRLARRVRWDWSHPASAQYHSSIMGTTAVRRSARLGGFETLIVLSSPMLRDTKYNRRLLIATFLHEMIHSYLFVVCGLKARSCGGHTTGFRQIADIIDRWVGKDRLHLVNIEADLNLFQSSDFPPSPTEASAAPSLPHVVIHGDDDSMVPDDRPNDDWRRPREDHSWSEPFPHHVPTQRAALDNDGWQWQEREGFLARVPPEERELVHHNEFHDGAADNAPFICLTPRAPRHQTLPSYSS
jgi:hypothetical protein